jgi:hypothetical protein
MRIAPSIHMIPLSLHMSIREYAQLEQRMVVCRQAFDGLKQRHRQQHHLPANQPSAPSTASPSTYSPNQQPTWGTQQSTHLDNTLELGTAALGRLRDQGRTLKAAHKRAMDLLTSTGVGRSLVAAINRTRRQDRYIFLAGLALLITLLAFLYWLSFAPLNNSNNSRL